MDSTRRPCLPPLACTDVKTNPSLRCTSGFDLDRSSTMANDLRRKSSVVNEKSPGRLGMGVEDDEVMQDLYTKMAHVQWRKHANRVSIRRAIDTSKTMSERELLLQLAVDREGERERWTKAIVRDELKRPADISEMFLKDWEHQEEKDRTRQLQENKLHLSSIKRVERAVKSKGSTYSLSNSTDNTGSIAAGEGKHEHDNSTSTALMDKLRILRSGIRQKRKELRRAMKRSDVRNSGFSAAGFKTGRGRH